MVNYECYIRWHPMRDYEALEEILVAAQKKVPDPFKNSWQNFSIPFMLSVAIIR